MKKHTHDCWRPPKAGNKTKSPSSGRKGSCPKTGPSSDLRRDDDQAVDSNLHLRRRSHALDTIARNINLQIRSIRTVSVSDRPNLYSLYTLELSGPEVLPCAGQLRRLYGGIVAVKPADLNDAVLSLGVGLPCVEGDGVLFPLAKTDWVGKYCGSSWGGHVAAAEGLAVQVEGAVENLG